jgi:hypothetical protein
MEAPVQLVTRALARSGIRFMLGGSLASAFHGIPRSTNDIDIVADIREEHIPQLASQLEGAFYADSESMREALRHGRSFNLIHFATGDKIDIFPAAGNRHTEVELERSKPQDVTFAEGLSVRCPVATAEDTILAKLVWYRLGGEQSDRQWNDLRGIRVVQGDALDRPYMQQWARELKVEDLLERLFSEDLLP